MSSTPVASVALSFVPASSSVSMSFDSPKQQEDVALKVHVASVCFMCLRCLICILQVFHVDVTYVAIAIHVCCKYVIPNISAVSDVCCKCFIYILHMLHTYVASVSCGCCICFTHMLQAFHLDVAYVLQ